MEQDPDRNDPSGFLHAAIEDMAENLERYWLSDWVRQRVPLAEEVLHKARSAVRELLKISPSLARAGPLPPDFRGVLDAARTLAEQNRGYALRRRALFLLAPQQLMAAKGSITALDAMVEAKVRELQHKTGGAGTQLVGGLGEAGPQLSGARQKGVPALLADLEGYHRDLRVIAVLDSDRIRRVARSRKAFEALCEEACPVVVDGEENTVKEQQLLPDSMDERIWQADAESAVLPGPHPEEEMALRVIWDALYIDLASAVDDRLCGARERVWELAKLVVQAAPGKPTRQFLRLVGWCYVMGPPPVCVILCRSVLDAALREVITDDMHNRHKKLKPNLYGRITIAWKEGIMDARARTLALNIKNRGDKAVHADPLATRDVLGTIRDTLVVLKAISRHRA